MSDATMLVLAAVGVHTSGMLRSSRQRLRDQNLQLESRVVARTAEIASANQLLVKEVAERKRSEEEAQRSGERFRSLFDSISDLLFSHDLDGRLLAVNRTAAMRLGYAPEELVGRPFFDLMRPEARPRFAAEYLPRVLEQGSDEGVVVIEARDGAGIYLAYRCQLVQGDDGASIVSGSGRDVTARVHSSRQVKALQSQLIHAQKMEAVGTLTSGISHDFNNILQSIIGYAQLALSCEPTESAAHHYLLELDSAAQRAAEVVRRLLLFSQGQAPELAPLDLSATVSATVRMLERTSLRGLMIDLKTGDRPLMIDGDQIQIEQLLANLCSNARDAMSGGGRLTVVSEEIEVKESYSNSQIRVKPGRYARLTVADTGCGMDEEVLGRAFEPFFTTKGVGKGTGLGLSTAYGVVQGHHGEIACSSRPGEGTVFEIYFPVPAGIREYPRLAVGSAGREGLVGSETILIVDDEPGILKVAQLGLARFGYTTITLGSGAEALELFGERQAQIDLSIVDLRMPGMDGLECLAGLRGIHPGARVLMASGNAAEDQVAAVTAAGAAGFIAKPYRIESLARSIREILDA